MLTHLSLQNYRNLSIDSDLGEGVNLLLEANGVGKSNLLESIYYTILGKSFRPIEQVTEVIGPAGDFAKVDITLPEHTISYVTTFTTRLVRKLTLDGKAKTHRDIQSLLSLVLFAPHSVDLVAGDPATRRDDLDTFLAFASANYATTLARYQKVVTNRNALLKQIRQSLASPDELAFWTEELISLGAKLASMRVELINSVLPFAAESAQALYRHAGVELVLAYETKFNVANYADQLSHKLMTNSENEIYAGQTLYGPHREDYTFLLNGNNLRYKGSRGEQRLGILIWELAQVKYLQELDKDILLLIDDLMSELDSTHRQNAATYLLDFGIQTIVTAADKHDVPRNLLQNATRIRLTAE